MKDDLGLNKIKKNYTYEYERKSVLQSDRLHPALFNEYVGLDERSFEDLVQQMVAYAKNIAFYDESTPNTILENKVTWETFFDSYRDGNGLFSMDVLEKKMNEGNVEPQLALMLAFLKLYQIEQNNFNGLLRRYHNFYYKDILGFSPLSGYIGKAVVFPTIEKQTDNVLIPKGALLDAGRDDNGKPIYYATCEDFSVNHVKVSDCVAYNNLDEIKEGNEQENSTDNSESKSEPQPYFQPICGKGSEQIKSSSSVLTDTYGIAISSEKFLVQDGLMHIIFEGLVSSDAKTQTCAPPFDIKNYEAEYTGEKEWAKGTLVYYDVEIDPNKKEKKRYICVYINQNEQPIVNYNKKIHGEGYDSSYPIVRLKVKNAEIVQKIKLNDFKKISVIVKDSQSAIIENKFGLVENRVGAMVFGSACEKNDYFQIKAPYDGLISPKPNVPFVNANIVNTYLEQQSYRPNFEEKAIWKYTLCSNTYSYTNESIQLAKRLIDYQKNSNYSYISCNYNTITLASPIKINYKIELKEFLIFPTTPFGVDKKLISNETDTAVNDEDKTNNENLFSLSSSLDMGENYLQIGLEGVTKPCIVSLYFKINSYILHGHYTPRWYYISNNKWTKMGGNILKDTTNNFRQSGCVTLSLDDDIITCGKTQNCLPNEKIWLKLNFKKKNSADEIDWEDIDLDERNKRDESQQENRTDIERFDFSAIEEVRAQGLEVEYSTESIGSLSHGTVLKAGSIKSLVTNIEGIKKIEQPYDGAMGRADENEDQFRARVSEKLRHKGKAWTGWDYERLILENFPQISAAKYLPCRNMNGKYQAGHTYILLAPDPQIIEQTDPLKPNMSWDLLYDIYQCVKKHATTFAQQEFHVMELKYDELMINCTVRLKKGLIDADYYESLINKELIKFIAPWSDNSQIVEFSRGIKQSDILYFIENLEYVDYVEEFGPHEIAYTIDGKYHKKNIPDENETSDDYKIIRSHEVTSILTSAYKHNIKVLLSKKDNADNNEIKDKTSKEEDKENDKQ